MDAASNELLKQLLAACARRDNAAFSELYDKTSSKLFGVALRILKRDDWAEDVLQDCYVSIWNNAHTYSGSLSAPMTWMTSIVRNRCLDWLRRPNREVSAQLFDGPESAGESLIDLVASEDAGPLEQLQRSKEAHSIARCLGELEEKQRRAITLAFYEGLSHSELAAHMKQPLGTVKTWVRRGLEKLKGCLG